ncbi:MAG: Gfo/Idh/MocA family oxidoreductase [Pseudomonadota bacterium]|nr:Gfo/Idh/MocA family oxidoreductase [Pseudomonadota bacterium]
MTALPADLLQHRLPDSRDAPVLNWGIMGPGWIAERFTASLQRYTTQNVAAVGSRDRARAQAMAGRFGIKTAHGSYRDLVNDDGIDIIYVSTPHPAHHEGALMALEAGRHVLVEKPLAINAAQARDIARAARAKGRFCMEALWTFFLPKFEVLERIIAGGWIGEVYAVIADHGEFFTPDHRIMRADLAGGPLLDLGTYPAALATRLLGPSQRLSAYGQAAPSGVNGQLAVAAEHRGGSQSLIHTTIFSNTPSMATIAGSRGTVVLDTPAYQPGGFTLWLHDGTRARYEEPAIGHEGGLHFQAAAIARSIAAGETESPRRPLADSIATLEMMDAIRAQTGIVFPGE